MKTAHTHRPVLRHASTTRLLLPGAVILLFMILPVPQASGQVMRWLMPDSVQPLDQPYNVDDDEFLTGLLYSKPTRDQADTVGILWEFARFMNASDWIWGRGYIWSDDESIQLRDFHRQIDTLTTLADSGERLMVGIPPTSDVAGSSLGGNGQMLEVFFFDSVQSPYSVWKFLEVDTAKGELHANDYYDNRDQFHQDWPWKDANPRERRFTDPQDSGLIAKHLVVQYKPWIHYTWGDHVAGIDEDPDHFLNLVYREKPANQRKMWVALKGHLGNQLDDSVANGDAIFRIELYHILSANRHYVDDSGDTVQVSSYTERLLDTFSVTKGDLLAGSQPRQAYRDVSFEIDLRYRFGDSTKYGVLSDPFLWRKDSARGSIAIDARVYWTGKEQPSVRSLMLRNERAELMYGTSSESDDFRREVLDSARRAVHGVDIFGNIDISAPMRESILRLDSGHEPFDYGMGAFRAVKRFLNDSLVYNNGVDTVQVGIIMNHPPLQKHLQWVGGPEAIHIEYGYMNFGYDTGTRRAASLRNPDSVSLPFYEIPAISEHNGGGGTNFAGPPELKLTQDSVDMYTESIQRGYYGFYTPVGDRSQHAGGVIQDLGYGARAAAQFGRALYGIAGSVSRLVIDTMNVSWSTYIDTVIVDTIVVNGVDSITRDTTYYDSLESSGYHRYITHQAEASEMRLHANLLLLFGGEGLTYYWLGTLHSSKNKFKIFETGYQGPDTLCWGNDDAFAVPGESFTDAMDGNLTDTVDWEVWNPKFWTAPHIPEGTFTDTLQGLWTGWKSRIAEMRKINERTDRIGSEMRRRGLEWRDAYSIHHQAIKPNSSDTSASFPGVRLLSSDEIITSITARNPLSGDVDSLWATYVEVGMFYTKTDSASTPNPLLDTNHLVVLNRRTFERPDDVSDTTERGQKMDSLTENRTLTIDFNLTHPDSTQYAFIRVREIQPDLTPLRLIGTRTALDTIIYGDSAAELTLGPGRAALLEITYEPGDTSIVDGELWWSNQRKMVYYDDDRFHCTYLRNDTVFYRRSEAMGDPAGSIIWESVEEIVSTDNFTTRVENWGPSMTMRTHNDANIVTIVWTCHSNDSIGVRDVVVRDLDVSGGTVTSSDIHFVDYHTGTDSTQWGDAVISAAHGGDIIAWGDSTIGILARVRKLAPFGTPPVYSVRDSVSLPWHTTQVGRWPTVPTFAHIRGSDSSCGIAWNQRMATGWYSEILYARILQLPDVGSTPRDTILNGQIMSAAPKLLGRPTIDQTQDVWSRVQEGIAWVELNGGWSLNQELLWFRSLYTPTNDAHPGTNEWDSIEYTQAWGFATTPGPQANSPDCYPNIASLNEVYYPIDDSLKDAYFSIAFVDYEYLPYGIQQATVQYAETSFKHAFPLAYAYDGDMPHGSSSPITQDHLHGVLYETDIPGIGPVLRTTRQFFGARAKPTGYIAEGRSVHFPINDSAATSIEVLMHDVWIADDASGTPLDLIERDFTRQTDTLAQVKDLLRTAYFSAGDSTRVGIELAGRFGGDSSIGGAARVSLIAELVDSASGTVVEQLDSIAVSAAADSHHVFHAEDYDLLSGKYYIRVRLDTASLSVENGPRGSRYPVAEYASRIEESPAARAAHYLGPTTGAGARISAQPNPLDDRTEIRFSITTGERVTVVIVDASGREVARPVRNEYFDAGRYAVALSTANFVEGTYMMELRAGSVRAIEKLIVRR